MKRQDDHWPIYRGDLHTASQTATQLTRVPSGDVCEPVYVEFSHTSVAHKVYRGVLVYREMTLPDFTAFVVRQCLEMGESGVVTGPGEEKKRPPEKTSSAGLARGETRWQWGNYPAGKEKGVDTWGRGPSCSSGKADPAAGCWQSWPAKSIRGGRKGGK